MKMKTIVYIDGFNLYYNALKYSSAKWLDIMAFCKTVLSQKNSIVKIKYFTANISEREDSSGAANRQKIYLKALQAHIPEIEIIRGHFSVHSKVSPLVTPGGQLDNSEITGRGKTICKWNQKIFNEVPQWKIDPGPKVHTISTEEKGSDVNLAVHVVNDGWKNLYDCCVIVSNDSDLAESLRVVKDELGKCTGLITTWKQRPVTKLRRYSTFTRTAREPAFINSQLPESIQIANSSTVLYKPNCW